MVKYTNGLVKSPQFFSDVYSYYIRGGHQVIFVENILNILTTASTLVFITFVSFFLDWVQIGKCQSEDTCLNMSHYVVYSTNFHTIPTNICMFIFVIMFAIYWMWTTFKLLGELVDFMKIRNYFKTIGIRTDEIKGLTWLDVIEKMIMYDDSLTAEIIVGSVMNKDNYLIAIIGSNLFKINPVYYTQTFLWLVNVGILNPIFRKANETGKIEIDIKEMVLTMRVLAVVQIVLLPFTFTLMIVNYVIALTTDIYTKKSYFGPKEWTVYASLLFREYNELPHIFNERIAKSYRYAKRYEQKFNTHMTNVIMGKLIFTLGTCLTLLVILTLYDERLVLYIKLFNRNLIWYVAILTTCVTVARTMMVSPSSVDESAEEIMEKIASHTHFFPVKWKYQCHKYSVLEDFKTLFKYKIMSVFLEIASIFVIPCYMCSDLSADIQLVADFIAKNTKHCEDIGYICTAGISSNLSIFSSTDDRYSTEYNLLVEDEKIERSIKHFNEYYHEVSTTNDVELGNTLFGSDIRRNPIDSSISNPIQKFQFKPNAGIKPIVRSNLPRSILGTSMTESEENAIL